jgi:hypothetical protein
MLGNYGIHTSVFPSAHVAGAFAAAFGMRQALPEHKWVSRFLYAMALLIAAATVYGRYHYFPDAVAGFLVAVIVLALQRCLVSRQAMTQPGAGRSASVSMPARNRAGFDSARNADLYLSMSSPESIMALDLLIQSQEQRRESLEAGPPKSTQTMLVKQ